MQLRAIVIDDDEACRLLLVQMLKRRGYEVFSLPSPEACPVFKDSECTCPKDAACGDFLLTDNQMPGITGLEFVARQVQAGCKGDVSNKAVLSGTWSQEELWQAQQLGCKVFDKPYRTGEIEAWLDAREKLIPEDRRLLDAETFTVVGRDKP